MSSAIQPATSGIVLLSSVQQVFRTIAAAFAWVATLIALLVSLPASAETPAVCFFDSDHYRFTPELYESMDALASRYPSLVEVVDYGDSYLKSVGKGGYDLRALHITSHSISGSKPVAMFIGGYHGNELPPPEMLMHFANWLLNGYGKDATATYLVNEHDIWIVPSVNPDQLGTERLSAHAVDLNRNHSYQWVLNGRLHGSAPASEPEVRGLETLATTVFGSIKSGGPTDPIPLGTPGLLVGLHGYLNAVSYPWTYTTATPPNLSPLKALAARVAKFNGYRSGQSSLVHYIASGTLNDYAFGLLGITSFLIEVDGIPGQTYASIDNNYWPVNQGGFALLTALSRAPLQLIDGPEVTQLSITSLNGTYKLTATAQANRVIDRVEYYLDLPPWRTGAVAKVMTASDGAFDKSIEGVETALNVLSMDARKHLVYVRARDTSGAWGAVQVVWLDLDRNTAPSIIMTSPAATTAVSAYSSALFSVQSVDGEGDPLTYSWLLDGRVLQACGTSSFTFFPTDSDLGVRQLMVRVSDGVKEASYTWQLNVAANNSLSPVILDDNSTATQLTGTWTTVASTTAYGGSTRYTDGNNVAFTWIPTLVQSGNHAVYARWPVAKTAGTAVPYTVTHDGGKSVVYVNQRDQGSANRWNLLGIFPLTQGVNGQVRMSSTGGRPFADAVLWAPSAHAPIALESIVDNSDTTATTRTGTWNSSALGMPWAGSALISSGLATFRWTPTIAAPGDYDVYAWWTYSTSRAVAAPFRILHADGEAIVTVNQRDLSKTGRWNYLGRFRFALKGGAVELSSVNGLVSADAVRLRPVVSHQ